MVQTTGGLRLDHCRSAHLEFFGRRARQSRGGSAGAQMRFFHDAIMMTQQKLLHRTNCWRGDARNENRHKNTKSKRRSGVLVSLRIQPPAAQPWPSSRSRRGRTGSTTPAAASSTTRRRRFLRPGPGPDLAKQKSATMGAASLLRRHMP